jgi:hypothetical protein
MHFRISSLLEGICAVEVWENAGCARERGERGGGDRTSAREGRSSWGAAGDGGTRWPAGNDDDPGPPAAGGEGSFGGRGRAPRRRKWAHAVHELLRRLRDPPPHELLHCLRDPSWALPPPSPPCRPPPSSLASPWLVGEEEQRRRPQIDDRHGPHRRAPPPRRATPRSACGGRRRRFHGGFLLASGGRDLQRTGGSQPLHYRFGLDSGDLSRVRRAGMQTTEHQRRLGLGLQRAPEGGILHSPLVVGEIKKWNMSAYRGKWRFASYWPCLILQQC